MSEHHESIWIDGIEFEVFDGPYEPDYCDVCGKPDTRDCGHLLITDVDEETGDVRHELEDSELTVCRACYRDLGGRME